MRIASGTRGESAEPIAALARGDERARARFFDVHASAVYGVLRMALPSQADAECALLATFEAAFDRAAELELADALPSADWVLGIAMDQLGSAPADDEVPAADAVPAAETNGHAAGSRTVAPAADATPSGRYAAADLQAVSDQTLRVLVRALDPRRRQALVLGPMLGLSDAGVEAATGIPAAALPALRRAALDEIREVLRGHRRSRSRLASESAYHLRPLPKQPMSNGMIVVIGDRAYIAEAPRNGFVYMARKAIERFIELLRRHRHHHDLEEDEVGGPDRPSRAPKPTPTIRPIKKPRPTPSMGSYKMPESSRGTQAHRSPRGTPSTARLSNPRRPLPSGMNAYGQRQGW